MATPIKILEQAVTVPLTVSAANTAISLVAPAVIGFCYEICYANWRVGGTAPVGAAPCTITISDSSGTFYNSDIAAAAPVGTASNFVSTDAIKCANGSAVTYAISSPANAGCIINANIGLRLKANY